MDVLFISSKIPYSFARAFIAEDVIIKKKSFFFFAYA